MKILNKYTIALLMATLFWLGYDLYSQAGYYLFNSPEHFQDQIMARGWVILWLLVSVTVLYRFRQHAQAPQLAMVLLSAYFVILYGILFRATEYGLNGHWGDNGNRLAYICKMMAYNTLFTDWRLKDLPPFYPPGWFAVMAVWAKLLGLKAYQTIKFGYLFVYLIYPWLLFWSWKRVIDPVKAAAVAIATIFFGYQLLDWISYEHMTAALFFPWWLYYFERDWKLDSSDYSWKYYLTGSIIGAGLFVTYYYWFFVAAAAVLFSITYRLFYHGGIKAVLIDLKHKSILMGGVALLTSFYWLPLLLSIKKYGSVSSQNQWFSLSHANLSGDLSAFSVIGFLIFIGLGMIAYLWQKERSGNLAFLLLGGIILIIIDRWVNLSSSSVQTRKILEFVHVFAMAPLAIGLMNIWSSQIPRPELSRFGLGLVLVLALLFANAHVAGIDHSKYEQGINQRVPEASIKAFSQVNTDRTVFLTHDYLDACYVPYYQFIMINNMSAHTAARHDQRTAFIKLVSKITEPDLLAYALRWNRYDPIDYIFLPLDRETKRWKLTLQFTSFNQPTTPVEIDFAIDPSQLGELFVNRHVWGIWEVAKVEYNPELIKALRASYPGVLAHLVVR